MAGEPVSYAIVVIEEPVKVCFDSGHFTHHGLNGAYAGLGRLLVDEDFLVESFGEQASIEALSSCEVLVIVWIEAGGGLLLVVDHAPVPGVARDLLELLGVLPLNGFTWTSEPGEKVFPNKPQVFDVARGTLKPHPITAVPLSSPRR